eukprot:TRINITY_DN11177_c0_g1_i1.p1 TRINITY_DN11177_c0_g1~~TRINITY_DN11177_c0_g1_i1.p1  ORF type:complete len:576 (-),score=61.13 TRINITY_DN11177_c0_g1_i1:295-2022(-)
MPSDGSAEPNVSSPFGRLSLASSRREWENKSAFAAACRELLRIHEEEVTALRLRCEELQKKPRSNANEELVTSRPSTSEQHVEPNLAEEASEAVLAQTRLGEEPQSQFDQVAVGARKAVPKASAASGRSSWAHLYFIHQTEHASAGNGSSDVAGRAASTLSSATSNMFSTIGGSMQTSSGRIERCVSGVCFEVLSGIMVFLNALTLAFEVQYNGHALGHTLQLSGHVTTAEEQYPSGKAVLEIFSWAFGVFFWIEVLLRIYVWLRTCVRDAWIWFDAFVIIVWTISNLDYFPFVDATTLRLARLLRLLRLLKLARALQYFDSLFTIITALKGCIDVLFWTFFTLGLVQLLLSLVLTQYLQTFYFPSADTSSDPVVVFSYYGTFLRSYFSLWEITLGNWPPACRILAEHVSEHFFMLGVIHKLVFGFAVVAVINGVFIQETFKATARDDMIMVRHKQQAVKHHVKKMQKLLKLADTNADGRISFKEWERITKDSGLRAWLASMDLDVYDAKLIFQLCDTSADGYLSFEELASGIGRFKGPAKNIDLHALAQQQLHFNHALLADTKSRHSLGHSDIC